MLKNEEIRQTYPFLQKRTKLFWSWVNHVWLHLHS